MSAAKKGRRKRPMTAYNFFFAEEHERIRVELQAKADAEADEEEQAVHEKAKAEGRPPPRKKRRKKISPRRSIGFDKLGKLIGTRWKGLGDADKARYKEMAAKDTARHKQEFEENYKASVESMLQKGGSRNDPSPLSGTETSVSSLHGTGFSSASTSSVALGADAGVGFGAYGYPSSINMPAAAGFANPLLPQYNAAADMGLGGMGMGSLMLTPEQQQLLQQNMLQSFYNISLPAATSIATSAMPTPPGATGAGMQQMGGLSLSNISIPATSTTPTAMPQQQQQHGEQPPQQQQQDGQVNTEHQRQLAEAERMWGLLLQQGAAQQVAGLPPLHPSVNQLQQHLDQAAQQQQQQQQQQDSEHQRMLDHASRMRELLIQNGATIIFAPHNRTPSDIEEAKKNGEV